MAASMHAATQQKLREHRGSICSAKLNPGARRNAIGILRRNLAVARNTECFLRFDTAVAKHAVSQPPNLARIQCVHGQEQAMGSVQESWPRWVSDFGLRLQDRQSHPRHFISRPQRHGPRCSQQRATGKRAATAPRQQCPRSILQATTKTKCTATQTYAEARRRPAPLLLKVELIVPTLICEKAACESGLDARKYVGSLVAPPGHGPRSTPALRGGSFVG